MTHASLRQLAARIATWPLASWLCLTRVTAQDLRPDSLADAGGDPYALSATGFLCLFAAVFLPLAVLVPWIQRWRLLAAGKGRGLGAEPDDAFELAMLTGGEPRALLTAVTWLVDRGHARVVEDKLVVESLPPEAAPPLVRAVAGFSPGSHGAREVMSGASCGPVLRDLRSRLVEKELLVPRGSRPREAFDGSMGIVVLSMVLVAWPRVSAASDAGRPYGYLVALGVCVVLVSVGVWRLLVAPLNDWTEGGRRVVARYDGVRARPGGETEGGVVASAAAFGAGALAISDIADVERFAEAGRRAASADASGSGCGDGGSGGGGCGGCGG